jgi:hypothetical protein
MTPKLSTGAVQKKTAAPGEVRAAEHEEKRGGTKGGQGTPREPTRDTKDLTRV